MNSELNNKLFKYHLVDYSKPAPHPILAPRPIEITKTEANSLNKGFALNRLTLRYVKMV